VDAPLIPASIDLAAVSRGVTRRRRDDARTTRASGVPFFDRGRTAPSTTTSCQFPPARGRWPISAFCAA